MTIAAIRKALTALTLALAPILVDPGHAQVPTISLQTLPSAAVRPAIDGIFDAFETHSLVGLSDKHGLAQEIEFYEALIRDPRFSDSVRNVVVEFGGASRQDVIDRYVDGEAVPYRLLRQVWTDTVGWLPTVQYVGYAHFLDQVRLVNATLPPDKHIRIWLGEPPVDWATIKTSDDYAAFLRVYPSRDRHAAQVIVREVLARKEKALVLYGGQHFGRLSAEERNLRARWVEADAANAQPAILTLQGLVELDYPDAFFIIQVYDGLNDETCTSRFETNISSWPMPALATPVRGTTLEREMRECPPQANIRFIFPPTMPQALRDLRRAEANDVLFRGDAVLFLGPAISLTRSPLFPDLYLDAEYRQEIERVVKIRMGQPPPPDWGRDPQLVQLPFRLSPARRR